MTRNRGQAAGERFDDATADIMPDHTVTRLHLLRHGAVEALEQRVVRGQLDVALSKEGREQSDRLAEWFAIAEPTPDRLFTSDLARCTYLGTALAERTHLPLEISNDLREQNMGSWQGQTWEAITQTDAPSVSAYWDDYVATSPPEGESLQDLFKRAQAWWQAVLLTSEGGSIVAVTHAGFIRSLICVLLKLPLTEALRFAPATASHTTLLYSSAGGVLTIFGERPWLFETAGGVQ